MAARSCFVGAEGGAAATATSARDDSTNARRRGTAPVRLRSACVRGSSLALRVGGRPRTGVLDVFVEPAQTFGEDVQQRFARSVAVRLVRQRHVPDRRAVAFERREEAL